jgi:aldehyde:ferredoxin oxidoreductase
VKKCFAVLGRELSDDDLTEAARRIYATKVRIKRALGFDWQQIKIPKRFFETPTSYGQLNEEFAQQIIAEFNKLVNEVSPV